MFEKKSRVWFIQKKLHKAVAEMSRPSLLKDIKMFNGDWCDGGLSNYKKIRIIKKRKFPHAVLFPNMQNSYYAINECYIKNIPSFSLGDTIDNMRGPTVCLPSNSRTYYSFFFFFFLACKAARQAKFYSSSSFLFSGIVKAIKVKKKFFKNLCKLYKKLHCHKTLCQCSTYF